MNSILKTRMAKSGEQFDCGKNVKKDKHLTFRTNQKERDVINEVCRRTGKNKAELISEFFKTALKQLKHKECKNFILNYEIKE